MRRSLKQRLKEGRLSVGTMLQFYCPELIEICGYAGMDFVSIDLEHGAFDYAQLKEMIRAAEAADLITVVRVPGVEEDAVKHALDLGASCLLVPNVDNADDLRRLKQFALYAPEGHRGSCPFVRQHQYGIRDNIRCYREANEDLVLWLTLESPASIDRENMRAIMEEGGFDLISIGAWDMAVAMGVPGQVTHPDILAAREYLEELNAAYGVGTGIHISSPADLSILKERPSARMVHLDIMQNLASGLCREMGTIREMLQ